MTTEGRHLICELHGGRVDLLEDQAFIEKIMREAALRAGATIIGSNFHKFQPQGVTGILLLSESHLSIHTWPERGYAAIDIYTCGAKTQPRKALEHLRREFHAMRVDVKEFQRGVHEAVSASEDGWFYEEEAQELHGYAVQEWVCRTRSQFQEIVILKNEFYGKVLFLDGASQSAESDEHIYHEALVHPVMLHHPNPERVLILGGGEGASLREVLRHKSVKSATMVDIDGELVEICRRDLPEWSQGAFEDPRAHLIIADGKKWVESSNEKFDVIVIDLTDQMDLGPSFDLYTKDFFTSLKKRLTLDGILVIQAGILMLGDSFTHSCLRRTLEETFGHSASYSQYVGSFFSEWSFVVAGNAESLPSLTAPGIDAEAKNRVKGPLRFYNEETHTRMFTIIPELKATIEREGIVVESKEQFLGARSGTFEAALAA